MIVEMELIRILMNEKRGEQMVVLKEKQGRLSLPIIIGIPEASAIKLQISGIAPPRPMTHDLLKDTIEHLGAKVEKVVINKIHNNTFYATIVLENAQKQQVNIDARPSDSIALALRADCPIFVSRELLDQAGVAEGS